MDHSNLDRRTILMAPPLMGFFGWLASESPYDLNKPPDPKQTFVLPYDKIKFEAWGNLPPHSGEMAKLYGDFDKPGPYLVMMKWNPGWFSAPHSYATDRMQVVVFGTWWVNSGNDFAPHDATPVGVGGYVKRTARTPHYDGVPQGQAAPAVIAIFGIGPVDMRLVDPTKPSWRQA